MSAASLLPQEVLDVIFLYLGPDDIGRAALVCRAWSESARRVCTRVLSASWDRQPLEPWTTDKRKDTDYDTVFRDPIGSLRTGMRPGATGRRRRRHANNSQRWRDKWTRLRRLDAVSCDDGEVSVEVRPVTIPWTVKAKNTARKVSLYESEGCCVVLHMGSVSVFYPPSSRPVAPGIDPDQLKWDNVTEDPKCPKPAVDVTLSGYCLATSHPQGLVCWWDLATLRLVYTKELAFSGSETGPVQIEWGPRSSPNGIPSFLLAVSWFPLPDPMYNLYWIENGGLRNKNTGSGSRLIKSSRPLKDGAFLFCNSGEAANCTFTAGLCAHYQSNDVDPEPSDHRSAGSLIQLFTYSPLTDTAGPQLCDEVDVSGVVAAISARGSTLVMAVEDLLDSDTEQEHLDLANATRIEVWSKIAGSPVTLVRVIADPANAVSFDLIYARHFGSITSIHVLGDRIITTSVDSSIRVWDVATGRMLTKLLHPIARCSYIIFASALTSSGLVTVEVGYAEKGGKQSSREVLGLYLSSWTWD